MVTTMSELASFVNENSFEPPLPTKIEPEDGFAPGPVKPMIER